MRERLFRFKQFSVCHQNSAMKIGVDAVLLGAWIDVNNCNTFLDVGCGCGVISLMIAQRSQNAIISGIDIDKLSVEESVYNAINTEWSDRLSFELKDYMTLNGVKYRSFFSASNIKSSSHFTGQINDIFPLSFRRVAPFEIKFRGDNPSSVACRAFSRNVDISSTPSS